MSPEDCPRNFLSIENPNNEHNLIRKLVLQNFSGENCFATNKKQITIFKL